MPRTPRLLAPWAGDPNGAPALYHCISRVVNREKVLRKAEKEQFVRFMRRYERFCGVRILTYCVMSNHFHLLVEVPPRPVDGLSDEEYFERVAGLRGEAEMWTVRRRVEELRAAGDDEEAEQLKEKELYRMWDLGQFMKSLKQCFSRWFNKRHDRCGTLWEERYKSVLVESGQAARVMAAYIDLNPVRAGMVDLPERYRWCGYAEAMGGNGQALAGLAGLMATYERAREGAQPTYLPEDFLKEYRLLLFHDGEQRERADEITGEVTIARRGIPADKVAEVMAAGGESKFGELLRTRVRAMTDGAVFGTRRFLEEFCESHLEWVHRKRRNAAQRIRDWPADLVCLRELRKE